MREEQPYHDPIPKAVMKQLNRKNTDDEKIVKFLQGKLKRTELSETMEKELENMRIMADLIRKHGSRLKVTEMFKNIQGVSDFTAFRLFEKTQRIFGATSSHDQQFWVDILLGGLMEDIRLARAKGDYRSVATLRKTMMTTIKDLLGSADANIYERIQPQLPVLGHWPEQLKTGVPTDPEKLGKIINSFMNKRRKKAYNNLAEDAETIDS